MHALIRSMYRFILTLRLRIKLMTQDQFDKESNGQGRMAHDAAEGKRAGPGRRDMAAGQLPGMSV